MSDTHDDHAATIEALRAESDQLRRHLDQTAADLERARDAARGATRRLNESRQQIAAALGLSDLVEDIVDEAIDRVASSIREDIDRLSDKAAALVDRVDLIEDTPLTDDIRAVVRDMITGGDIVVSLDVM